MSRQSFEVGDIFRDYGQAWIERYKGAINASQYKVMNAIKCCRSAALGGHLLYCSSCDKQQIAYNSCRNRHCPKCQSSEAKRWLEAREQDLLPVDYYHAVFTVPSLIGRIAYQNKRLVYTMIFNAASKALLKVGANENHLGGKIGFTMVLHTWGSAMTHHPHVHCIIPGGALTGDDRRWKPCKPRFLLPVRALSLLFRRLFLEELIAAYDADELEFHGQLEEFRNIVKFHKAIRQEKKTQWVVYLKRPFSGPKAVLNYLSRYTHRVAIANSRIVDVTNGNVSFKWKDYKAKEGSRNKTMTLSVDEFIRRFLLHTLPYRFHRIRHYGFLANTVRRDAIALLRDVLEDIKATERENHQEDTKETEPLIPSFPCPHCAKPMVIIDAIPRHAQQRAPPLKGLLNAS